jgi:hypothetical protein
MSAGERVNDLSESANILHGKSAVSGTRSRFWLWRTASRWGTLVVRSQFRLDGLHSGRYVGHLPKQFELRQETANG